MPLKKSSGNMYDWTTHTHNHLAGECPHRCSYCYVDSPRFGRPERYKGEIRVIEDEFKVHYGIGRTIFVENMGDLFAEAVPAKSINLILSHCRMYPGSTYVLQTKNPGRIIRDGFHVNLPPDCIVGTTIETNRYVPAVMGTAPRPADRWQAMCDLKLKNLPGVSLFVTIEPVMEFDLEVMVGWMDVLRPAFVNIGADSKGKGLPEPRHEAVIDLAARIMALGIEVRNKHNLGGLAKRQQEEVGA